MTRRPNDLLQDAVVLSLDFPGAGFTAAIAASGTILCTTDAAAGDGDTVTIGDGIKFPVVFEYDKSANGVAGTNTVWAAGTTAASNATALRLLIIAAFPSLSVVDDLAGTLTITHKWPGAGGNVTITETGAVCTTVTGMSGGAAAVATSISADSTVKFHKARRAFRLDKAEVISPTGLVQDAANYFNIKVLKGSTIMANWSTLTGAEGTLTANTFKTMVLSATDANLVADADDVLSLFLDETGTAVLPSGRVVLHGRYL